MSSSSEFKLIFLTRLVRTKTVLAISYTDNETGSMNESITTAKTEKVKKLLKMMCESCNDSRSSRLLSVIFYVLFLEKKQETCIQTWSHVCPSCGIFFSPPLLHLNHTKTNKTSYQVYRTNNFVWRFILTLNNQRTNKNVIQWTYIRNWLHSPDLTLKTSVEPT